MQHEIIEKKSLLNAEGNICEPGYAKKLILDYRRNDIKAGALRIKEWDYYIVGNDRHAAAFTIADNAYMGLISASVLDFTKPWEKTTTVMEFMTRGKYALPETSDSGDTMFKNKKVDMSFKVSRDKRRIICSFADFLDGNTLEADITLQRHNSDSMVIVTPFDKPKHFYYNQKINCMRAEGVVRLCGKEYALSSDDSFGTLDWGRGVWTYDNTWYWGNGNGTVNAKPFGFNIGYGFGNTSAASENMLFYDGKAHKLSEVRFNIPADSYMKPWTFSSDDGRFEMDFIPVLDRAAHTNALIIESDQHQVFGKFTGKAVLDDGTVLEIHDLLGFAEKVRNRY